MVKNEELDWLGQEFPGLKVIPNGVSGAVSFTASWDANRSGREFVLSPWQEDELTGETLVVSFTIHVTNRQATSASRLPALRIEGLGPSLDRHLQLPDGSACLISPLEEDPFLVPEFSFRVFFEELVLPFLYGQQFYELHERWPWGEYSHGVLGVLESYGRLKNPNDSQIAECLRQLKREPGAWSALRSLLRTLGDIKGFERCRLCQSGLRLRDCHPEALLGIRRLRESLKEAPHLRTALAEGPTFLQNRRERRREQRRKI